MTSNTAAPRAGAPPRVSIGLPVYNAGATFAQTIEALLGQSFTDIELIISDNASTDDSVAVAERYVAADPRVTLLRAPQNVGANPNYRKVARAARGEYFKWASCNDLIDPNFIAVCVAVLDSRPDAVLCHGQTMIFGDDPATAQRYEGDLALEMDDPIERFITLCSRMQLNNILNGVIRREPLLRTTLMGDYMGSDNVMMGELALHGKFTLTDGTKFYRKLDEASATALQSRHKVIAHHYPRGGLRSQFQTWQQIGGYLRAAMRAPLTTLQHLRAIGYVMRSIYWSAPDLIGDLGIPVRFFRGSRQRRI